VGQNVRTGEVKAMSVHAVIADHGLHDDVLTAGNDALPADFKITHE
jgi:hypothetical protein